MTQRLHSLRSAGEHTTRFARQCGAQELFASRLTGTPKRRGRSPAAGKFELYKDKGGKFRFRLKAGNGEIIAVGEAYDSKAAAKNGVESLQKNAAGATQYSTHWDRHANWAHTQTIRRAWRNSSAR